MAQAIRSLARAEGVPAVAASSVLPAVEAEMAEPVATAPFLDLLWATLEAGADASARARTAAATAADTLLTMARPARPTRGVGAEALATEASARPPAGAAS